MAYTANQHPSSRLLDGDSHRSKNCALKEKSSAPELTKYILNLDSF